MGRNNKGHQISVCVDGPMYEYIQRQAGSSNVTISSVVRTMIIRAQYADYLTNVMQKVDAIEQRLETHLMAHRKGFQPKP